MRTITFVSIVLLQSHLVLGAEGAMPIPVLPEFCAADLTQSCDSPVLEERLPCSAAESFMRAICVPPLPVITELHVSATCPDKMCNLIVRAKSYDAVPYDENHDFPKDITPAGMTRMIQDIVARFRERFPAAAPLPTSERRLHGSV